MTTPSGTTVERDALADIGTGDAPRLRHRYLIPVGTPIPSGTAALCGYVTPVALHDGLGDADTRRKCQACASVEVPDGF